MHRAITIAFIATLAGTGADAATIVGLCNTGQNNNCTAVANGNGNDTNWSLTGGPTPNAFRMRRINGAWIVEDATSRWLGPTNDGSDTLNPAADGLYAYALTFQIPRGLNANTAQFLGRFAVDNLVDSIMLNGTTLAANGGSFNRWTAFGATGGFRTGLNTLTFNVRNQAQATGNPTGLRVEFSSSSIGAVPEPATWAMMILGFGLIGGALRRRRSHTTAHAAIA